MISEHNSTTTCSTGFA